MGQRFKCVVFDVDGTLLDTSEGILSSVRYTIDHFNLDPLDDNTIKSFIGPPIQKSFQRIYKFDNHIISDMAAVFRDRYKNYDLLHAKPYDGIFDVFEYLHSAGIRTAVATYKREDYALRLLQHFGFDRYTDAICGSDFDGKLTKKDIIELSLRKSSCADYAMAVMVGDSDNDAIGAADLGIPFLGVTYGFGFKTEEDISALHAIGSADHPRDIIEIISEKNR